MHRSSNPVSSPVLRVAFVAIVAILAMLYMASLLGKTHSSVVSTGAAYTSPQQPGFVMDASGSAQDTPSQNSLVTDGNPNPLVDDTSTQMQTEDEQTQLAKIIAEPDSAKKAIMAQQMSRFTSSPPSSSLFVTTDPD